MANNLDILDGAGATKTVKTTDNAGVHTPHHAIDGTVTVTGAGGSFPVTDSGGSLTVDGTVAATQSGTWNITNVSGTISLPTGASTAAKQPALGTAGTASADVITIQGIASMTPLAVSDNAGSLTVDGTVAVSSVGGSVAVTGTFWQATQPVSAASLPLPTGASTLSEQQTQTTALQLIDDAVLAVDAVGTGGKVTLAGAIRDDALSSLTPVEGDAVNLRTDANGALWVIPSGTVTISGAVTNAGTFAVQAAQSGTWNVGTVTTVSTVTSLTQMNGQAIAMGTGVRSAGTQRVTIATDDVVPASQSGTWNVATLTTLTGGGVAHDGADSGNPHKLGAKAIAALSGATLVAAADRTDLYAGVDGVLITRPHCSLEDVVSGNASNTDGTSTQCIAAQAAGIKTYLTSVILTNTSASNIYVEIKDGTTVKLTIPVPANSGAVVPLPVPLGGTAATAWNFDPSAATSTVFCSMVGFKSKI